MSHTRIAADEAVTPMTSATKSHGSPFLHVVRDDCPHSVKKASRMPAMRVIPINRNDCDGFSVYLSNARKASTGNGTNMQKWTILSDWRPSMETGTLGVFSKCQKQRKSTPARYRKNSILNVFLTAGFI